MFVRHAASPDPTAAWQAIERSPPGKLYAEKGSADWQ